MTNKNQDPNLQAPQESNTTKHINFLEAESEDSTGNTVDNDNGEESPTKKAWEELRRDQQGKDASTL